ncbi:MAG: hypothetical protein K0U68_07715 [Gammaproteobacteria bacterium]|nr:hypothetical protein [Gammaproteobacteria bacterium]
MSELSSTIGFVVISVLYIVIGLLAVAGSIAVSRKLFSPRHEQVLYGLLLVLIAGFYLSFTAYFGDNKAWALESNAVLVFLLLGIIGTRIPAALILGYPLHGIWDVIHELHTHTSITIFDLQQLTAIPLAYGIFCATYDIGIAIYFFSRRTEWARSWQSKNS